MQFITEKHFKSNLLKLLSLSLIALAFTAFTPYKAAGPNAYDYRLIKKVPVKADFLTTDFLKNVYIITSQNQVMKYDSLGREVGIFSDKNMGNITSIDATAPFNVLVFSRDDSKVITTSINMQKRELYKLSSIGINNVSAVCLSHDSYIWIYDVDDARLKKINRNYEIIYKSPNLKRILGEGLGEPNFLVERDGLIYMHIPNMGIVMFDIYGTYYSSIPATKIGKSDLQSFQVIEGKIVFFDNGILYVYNTASQNHQRISVPKSASTKDVKVELGKLYMLQNSDLMLYSIY